MAASTHILLDGETFSYSYRKRQRLTRPHHAFLCKSNTYFITGEQNERSLIHIPHQYYIPDVLFLQGIQLDWNSRLNPVADKIA